MDKPIMLDDERPLLRGRQPTGTEEISWFDVDHACIFDPVAYLATHRSEKGEVVTARQ
jgi:hypothetical protein